MGKKGIIFDLDGTLWDACAGIAASWDEYVRLYEPEWYAKGVRVKEETVRAACGKTMDIFTAMLLHQLPPEEQRRLYEPCCTYEVGYLKVHGAGVYPGVQETLRELAREYALYIVSNCQEGYIQAFTFWSGLEDVIADTEDYGSTGKMKAENIRLLMERNGLKEAIYVGDTQGDYESALQAGIPFVFAAYGFGQVDASVPCVNSIRELIGLCAERGDLFQPEEGDR